MCFPFPRVLFFRFHVSFFGCAFHSKHQFFWWKNNAEWWKALPGAIVMTDLIVRSSEIQTFEDLEIQKPAKFFAPPKKNKIFPQKEAGASFFRGKLAVRLGGEYCLFSFRSTYLSVLQFGTHNVLVVSIVENQQLLLLHQLLVIGLTIWNMKKPAAIVRYKDMVQLMVQKSGEHQ